MYESSFADAVSHFTAHGYTGGFRAENGELRDSEGAKLGTYVVAFGPQMDRLDAEAVRRLRDARHRKAEAGRSS